MCDFNFPDEGFITSEGDNRALKVYFVFCRTIAEDDDTIDGCSGISLLKGE